MKKWIKKDLTTAYSLLAELGVATLHELQNSTLLLNVSSSKDGDEGVSLLVKVRTVYIGQECLLFEYEDRPIKVRFDGRPGVRFTGEFDNLPHDAEIEIDCLELARDGWNATYRNQLGEAGTIVHHNLGGTVLTAAAEKKLKVRV